MSTEHGWTRHGHRCCDQATGPRPSRVARCGGPAICRECAADAAGRHSPGSGTYEPDPDLSFVATAGGNADEPAVLLLPEHLAEVAAFVRSQRAAGWREAIEALRDDDRYAAWDLAQVEPRTPLQAVHRDVAADYLETLSTGDAP